MHVRSLARLARCCLIGLVLALELGVAAPPPALAQPSAAQKETARGLVLSGRKKRDQGDNKGALKDFSNAWSLVKNPTTGFELGNHQAEMGQLVEARDTLLEVGRLPVEAPEPTPFTRAREEAKSLADRLATAIPSLKLVIEGLKEGAAFEVRVDDVVIQPGLLATPLKVNPGIHKVVVRQGLEEKASETMLARGEQRELKVILGAPPSNAEATGAAPPLPHWLTWVGLGVAVGGGVAGSVTGALAIQRSNEVAAGCPNNECPPALHDTLDEGHALAIGSTIAFSLGGAGLAAMVVGLFLPPETSTGTGSAARSIKVGIAPTSLSIGGSFP